MSDLLGALLRYWQGHKEASAALTAERFAEGMAKANAADREIGLLLNPPKVSESQEAA